MRGSGPGLPDPRKLRKSAKNKLLNEDNMSFYGTKMVL